MSSTAGSHAKGPAPWKSSFLADINKMDSPEFVFSSLRAAPKGSPTDYLPRARYCIFRGLWAELPENKHNEAPMNERVFESEMPTFTSDVRMMKIPEVFGSSAGHATKPEQSRGSGGGGPCEAVWWVKETQTQWRIKGEAFVVGPDIEGEGEESSGVRTVKSEVGSRMTIVKPGEEGNWSWAKELTAHFGNNSPGLRGSFRAPPPGQPTSEPYDDKELQLGSKVEDLNDPVARKNFRVMVIKPEQVEKLDLSDPVKARRQKYTFVDSSAEWKHEECWP
ncbi:pyridoxamine 5'-phosphate oxidase-domain-containing protein [Cryomyces antarcticus]